jgi:predicted ATPase
MTVVASERVVGREDELAAVERWLDRAGDAPPGLLLEGEPGIGKSTLWEAAVDRAQRRGLRVLQARPAEAERDLPFAALTDLLGELSTSGLPAPQRRALDAALRRAESTTPPDPTALGLAVRVLLATTPTLLAVDDLQWLDPESVRTLSFALRRAPEPPTLVLATARSGSAAGTELSHALSEGGLSRLELGRLSLDDLAAVIRTVFDTSFTRPTLVRLWETSRGNAFFAIELLRAAQRSGGVDAAFALPTTPTLEALVASRLDLASPRAREAVAAVAALSRPTVALVTEATGAGDAEITEAVDLELLQLDGERLSVTHPLLASAAYHALPAVERRALHGRLAQLCPTPEECALHLAVATAVPDESVAATIEDAAASAARRGARSAAERVGKARQPK